MNQLKTFFKIVDKVFGEVLGKDVVNFNSNKNYSDFIECKDTHKAWQSLDVYLHGMTMELLTMYITTLEEGIQPSTIGFLEWQKQQSDKKKTTLRFLTQLTFNAALAIYIQRVGD